MDDWLQSRLVCPRDHQRLERRSSDFVCAAGHCYPVVEDVPIFLLKEEQATHGAFRDTLAAGLAPRRGIPQAEAGAVDPFVQDNVAATCGNFYKPLIGKLKEYPIPDIPLPPSDGGRFLDIGCNWGRWCLAAAQKGYRPVGIDPQIDAILAACRVARQLKIDASFMVADARHLPFENASFDVVHSYSVLMHLARQDARSALEEVARVLRPHGRSIIQMGNAFGVWNICHQLRRRLKESNDRVSFQVRYWTPANLMSTFERTIGPSRLEIDGFFFTSAGAASLSALPLRFRLALALSSRLKALGENVPWLRFIADSLYVISKPAGVSPPPRPQTQPDRS